MGIFTRTPDPPSTVPWVKPAGEAARVIKPSELLQEREARRPTQEIAPPKADPTAHQVRREKSEAERLEELERRIKSAIKLGWLVGANSLVEIRDRELFKPHASTMDAYLETRGKERFGVKKRRCHDLMRAAAVAKNCRQVTHELCLAAALALADLPAEKQAFGLGEAIKLAGHRAPTARQVAEAIAPYLQASGVRRRAPGKKKPRPIKYRSKAGRATVLLAPGVDLLAMLLEWVAKLQAPKDEVRTP